MAYYPVWIPRIRVRSDTNALIEGAPDLFSITVAVCIKMDKKCDTIDLFFDLHSVDPNRMNVLPR